MSVQLSQEVAEELRRSTKRRGGLAAFARRHAISHRTARRWADSIGIRKIYNRVYEGVSAKVERDARRLMDDVPEDCRDLTGRMFGDPLPGRSALDMRASQ